MVMLRFCLALLLAVMVTSCGPRFNDYYPYNEDGRSKPMVILLPMIDRSDSGLCWNVAEEIEQNLRFRLMDNGYLYVLPDKAYASALNGVDEADYFGADIDFASNFCNGEFVVAMELMEHCIVPYVPQTITPIYPVYNRSCDNVLMMKLRLRIIDIRCGKPKVILQEIVQSNHMIPRDRDNLDYTSFCWGSAPYCRTPLALDHQRLASDVAARIEKITCTAR